MVYAISGINGSLETYNEIKEKIGPKKRDDIYILGGLLGSSGDYSLIFELMGEENVFPVGSEKELKTLKYLSFLKDNQTSDDQSMRKELENWLIAGKNYKNAEGFLSLDADEKQDVVDYLGECTLGEQIELAGKTVTLCAAGISGFRGGTPIDAYDETDLAGAEKLPERATLMENEYYIVGSFEVLSKDGGKEIYRDGGIIVLCHEGSTGGVGIRLDDLEEYYAR